MFKSRHLGINEDVIEYLEKGNKKIRYKMNKLKILGKILML